MFFSLDLLCMQKKGPFVLPWIVGTAGVGRISNKEILNCNIFKLCDEIQNYINNETIRPGKRFSLRLSSILINGVVKIHNKRVILLINEIVDFTQLVRSPLILRESPPSQASTLPTPIPRVKAKRTRRVNVLSTQESTPPASAVVVPDVEAVQEPEVPLDSTPIASDGIDRYRNERESRKRTLDAVVNMIPDTETIENLNQVQPIDQPIQDTPIEPPPIPDEDQLPAEIVPIAPIVEEMVLEEERIIAAQDIGEEIRRVEEELPPPESNNTSKRARIRDLLNKPNGTKARKPVKSLISLRVTRNVNINRCAFDDNESLTLLNKKSAPFTLQWTVPEINLNTLFFVYFESADEIRAHSTLAEESLKSRSGDFSQNRTRTPSLRGVTQQPSLEHILPDGDIIPAALPVEDIPLTPLTPRKRPRTSSHPLQVTTVEVIPAGAEAPNVEVQLVDADSPIIRSSAHVTAKRQKDLLEQIKKWDFKRNGDLTLEDVCVKPVNRYNIATAFGDVLSLHKKQYVKLVSDENSLEFKGIRKGIKLTKD